MIKIFAGLVLLGASGFQTAAAAQASVTECAAMASSIQSRQAKLAAEAATAEAMAAKADAAGERFENDAALAGLSERYSHAADEAREEFELLRVKAMQQHNAVSERARRLNADTRRFNALCADQ